MSIRAKLYIDEVEYTVLKFDFDFKKGADVNGRPSTKFNGGLFNFAIESVNKSDILLWSVNPTEMKEVKLVITPSHNMGKSRTIILGDAICLSFSNEYFSADDQPLKEYFTVSPGYMLQNGQTIFEKNWKVTDLTNNVEATAITKAEEPRLIEYHFEDIDENPLEKSKIKIDDFFYLVINSENAIGESITINLDDNFKDFEYNGSPLSNDTLKDVTITDDLFKVKLKAIKQKNNNG